jgi:hypothetical protein
VLRGVERRGGIPAIIVVVRQVAFGGYVDSVINGYITPYGGGYIV